MIRLFGSSVNKFAQELYGLSPDDCLGKTDLEIAAKFQNIACFNIAPNRRNGSKETPPRNRKFLMA